MIKTFSILTLLSSFFLFLNCSVQKGTVKDKDSTSDYKYLALGDSYTIGESVCDTCRFPEQLKKELDQRLNEQGDLKIIAKTGWTTTDLLNAIAQQKPSNKYDLVTLLIGVNNQYQGQPFSTYEKEFPELLSKAIQFAGGNKDNVIVVSIPDYAFTPFGQTKNNPSKISEELGQYDAYAKNISEKEGVAAFVNITPITRKGLEDETLVASDGLHPSKEAYNQFVKLLSVKAVEILK
ncbi:SGNH/GDSL hydrolase family protein [Marixanthomonas ophiurae]|uniref:SGNH/GDSL hydrolase family protein n=1 Tax=Marixanthomonas ophiurae TaxID=387659 RepID=A0A3E1QB87_9FLAO|nr:SGNH/GDSL hydrolase family protein [Marixanthomonas ophiurae]RFN59409.1 SGNH/GDSL hydrolase family protein [Marixanthomonas ophiurae]